MVHHFFFFRPIRTLFGLMLIAAAVLCFYNAAHHNRFDAGYDWPFAKTTEAGKVPINESAPIPNPPSPNSDHGTTRPDWVGKPPHLASHDGIEVYVTTATAGPYSTPEECDRALGSEIDRVVADFAEKQFDPAPDQPVKLGRDEIQHHLIKDRYRETVDSPSVGPMQEEHVLLEFDSQVRAAIEQAWRSTIVDQRLKFAAVGSGALLLALGGVYSLLKWKPTAAQRS